MSGTHSLRRRLLGSVMTAILVAALFQAASAYRGALQQADEMFDYHLQQMAYALRNGAPSQLEPTESELEADYEVQIWSANGVQLFQSHHNRLPAQAVLGFSDVEQNGTRYRVYSIQTTAQTIQIAQDLSARQARARALAARAMLPMAWMAPLLMLALWWTIRHALKPLERTRQQVASRAADDLSPLAEDGLPDEVRPLVHELNLLFDRVHTAFHAQQSFVANAAHELRSPLTALKLQAQALDRAADAPTRSVAVARLHQGIDRAIRLMNQLLVLARQESASETPPERIQLQDLVRLAVEEMLPQAQERQQDIGVAPSEPIWVQGHADALRILLRNLLDNALKYTPEHGRVDVAIALEKGAPVLSVDDSGPGIAEEDMGRVFDRFFRSASATASGSGLGLAIAQAIAQRHGAQLRLGSSAKLGGLRVTLEFPGTVG
ncbi:two-component system, OmpR family, sensor kinase [Rhodoferax sp. OV413]|uniref:ATP-binding protein n=1 Tax=Rhodoferax sp. OV413 TaxID=1855285 RepID=UPI00087F3361|nr:ATP-binding protein [Rhodoferax sp. OV413]SDP58875.1 two-component system, OmpR family, sensor kinase [Rhodoferax sp. OV413]